MSRSSRNYLFSDADLRASLDRQLRSTLDSVTKLPRDQFLGTSVDTLVEHFVANDTVNPLVLHEDQIQMDQRESNVDVSGRFDYGGFGDERIIAPGHELTFYVPFSGDAELWRLRPDMWMSVMPDGQVDARSGCLVVTRVNAGNTEAAWYKQELERVLSGCRQLIQAQTRMIEQYQSQLPGQIRAAIEKRRNEIEKLQGIAAAFDIPMVKKSGMPEFKPIELVRKVSRPLPRMATPGHKPVPAIAEVTYEEILAVIRHAGASFEGAPQTYAPLGEEGLRDNVLSHINVIFEGKATGETFRKYGKTDIRLEEDSRSAFVAECKIWGGEKLLLEALDQLLGYLTWRDCKTAIVIFNKDVAAFSAIQESIARAFPNAKGYLRTKETGRAGEWRFVFQSKEDPAIEVTVHVFAFNLYVAPERSGKKR